MTGLWPRAGLSLALLVPATALLYVAHLVSAGAPARQREARLEAVFAEALSLRRAPPLVRFGGDNGTGVAWYLPASGTPRACVGVVAGEGYRSRIEIAVVVAGGAVARVAVLAHDESSRFGALALEDPNWLARFEGLRIGTRIAPRRVGGAIDAVSGATITSETVIDLVARAARAASACPAAGGSGR